MSNQDKVVVKYDRHATLKITTRHPKTKAYSDIRNAVLVFQIKRNLDINEAVITDKKNQSAGGSSAEIEDYSLISGIYKVHLAPDDLTGLDIDGSYWCETKMTLSGKDATIFQKPFMVTKTLID